MTTRTGVAPRKQSRGPSQHATPGRPGGVALQLLCAATTHAIDMPVKGDEPRIACWVWHRALAGRTDAGSNTLGKPLCPKFVDTTRPPRCARRAAPTSAIRCRGTSAASIRYWQSCKGISVGRNATEVDCPAEELVPNWVGPRPKKACRLGPEPVHAALSRTSIFPVTAADIGAVRSSLRRRIASRTFTTRPSILAVSRSRCIAMAFCSSVGGTGIGLLERSRSILRFPWVFTVGSGVAAIACSEFLACICRSPRAAWRPIRVERRVCEDALVDRRQKTEDAFAYYVECVRGRDNGIGRSTIVAPEAIQTGVRVERRCKGKRSVRSPVGRTAGETRLHRLPEHGAIEAERLRERPDVMEVLHAAILATQLHDGFELLGDAGYTRIRPHRGSGHAIQERWELDVLRSRDNDVAESDVHLNRNPLAFPSRLVSLTR